LPHSIPVHVIVRDTTESTMPLASKTGVSYQNGSQYRPNARVL